MHYYFHHYTLFHFLYFVCQYYKSFSNVSFYFRQRNKLEDEWLCSSILQAKTFSLLGVKKQNKKTYFFPPGKSTVSKSNVNYRGDLTGLKDYIIY